MRLNEWAPRKRNGAQVAAHELHVIQSGYRSGQHMVDTVSHHSRSDAWQRSHDWIESVRQEARRRPRNRAAAEILQWVREGVWPAYAAGHHAGVVAALFARFGGDGMTDAEAHALGVAQGHGIVYATRWPRLASPSDVSLLAVQHAVDESLQPRIEVLQLLGEGHLLQAYSQGLLVGVAEGTNVYFRQSGRRHLRLMPPPNPANLQGETPRGRKAKARPKSGRAR